MAREHTIRERILAVYRGETPDRVPFMLDLSHWFYHRHHRPWDLSATYEEPEYDLIDFHRKAGIGFYMPNLGSFYSTSYPSDIKASVEKSPDGRTIIWSFETPLGKIRRARQWMDQTYAWGITEYGVHNERDLAVLARALKNRAFAPRWDQYRRWQEYVGDTGVVYLPMPYSAMGQLLHYWMGIENVVYASCDWPQPLGEAIDIINRNNLRLVDLFCTSPAEIVIMGDNFSSDIQSPSFFDRWSRAYYREAIDRLHQAGKFVAVHIDGRLRGALKMIRETGADCADAVTPLPMGDLTPAECREEAGNGFILSGGVSPDLWLPETDIESFKGAALDWIALKDKSSRLIANAGDQVPPNAVEERIRLMRDMVETLGKY